MPAVHDLADDVAQVFPGYLGISIQVVGSALAAAQQVARVKRVIHIPTNPCTSTRSLCHTRFCYMQVLMCRSSAQCTADCPGLKLSIHIYVPAILFPALCHALLQRTGRNKAGHANLVD